MTDLATENLRRELTPILDNYGDATAELMEPLLKVIRRHQAAAWDDACMAMGWAIDNGPIEAAAAYVSENNRYNDPA